MLADTHAHLYWDSFKEDINDVIQRSKDSGLSLIINVGVDLGRSAQALKQVKEDFSKYTGVKFLSSIGLHPHEAIKYQTPESIEKAITGLETIHQSDPEKVVLVGECGLDFFFDNNPDYVDTSLSIEQNKDLQRKLFKAQIELAKKLNLPITVHIRDDRNKDPENSECWDEALEMLQDSFGILHCYSGLPETTEKALKMEKFLFSFAANITYPRNEYLREAAKLIPLDRIVFETDCPFLAPQSRRGQRNEPMSVRESAELVAALKGISLEEVAKQTTENVKKLLRLS